MRNSAILRFLSCWFQRSKRKPWWKWLRPGVGPPPQGWHWYGGRRSIDYRNTEDRKANKPTRYLYGVGLCIKGGEEGDVNVFICSGQHSTLFGYRRRTKWMDLAEMRR